MCVPRATRACPIAEGIEYTCTPSPFQLARLMDFLFTVQMKVKKRVSVSVTIR